MVNTNKNPHYKSTAEFYNTSSQALTATVTPLNILGTLVTDTGIAIDVDSTTFEIGYSGTYKVSADVVVDATTAGDVTIQLYANSIALPETLRTITVAAGNNLITLQTIRSYRICQDNVKLQLCANTDGTAAGSVILVSGNAEKLA